MQPTKYRRRIKPEYGWLPRSFGLQSRILVGPTDVADSPFHRILPMTLHATGARRAEAVHLFNERVVDIPLFEPPLQPR